MSSLTPMGSTSKLVEIFAKRVEFEKSTTPTNVLGSPFVQMPRIFADNDSPPFKRPMPRNPKRSDTMRITPSLLEASARLAQVMMQPDPEFAQLQDSKLERQQKKKNDMAEDKFPFSRPFLQSNDEEVIEPHVNTYGSAPNDLGRVEQVFWGAAIAHRLPNGDAGGNEDHQGISRHLIIPTRTPGGPAMSASSAVTPPSRREVLIDSAVATGFKPNLREDKPLMTLLPPAYAGRVSSPVTQSVEPIRLPRALQKALRVPPAPHERSMSRTQRRLLTTLSSRSNPNHVIYTHSSTPLFLPPDFVAPATTAIPPAKKRRSHPTEDEVNLMMSDEERKLQPLKKKRSVKLMTKSMGVSQGNKSTPLRKTKISPHVSIWDQVSKSSSEDRTPEYPLKDQIPLPKISPYISAWDQVPKSSSEKAVSTLSPYVSTWNQVPKSLSHEIPQEPLPGQITLPVENKTHVFFTLDVDAETATKMKGSASHALAGSNISTSAASASSPVKEESEPSESVLETVGSNTEETCLATLLITN